MANKIAKSGLVLAHLEAVYNLNTEKHNAITRLLSKRFKGKIRVTNNKKVICGLVKWLEMKQSCKLMTILIKIELGNEVPNRN